MQRRAAAAGGKGCHAPGRAQRRDSQSGPRKMARLPGRTVPALPRGAPAGVVVGGYVMWVSLNASLLGLLGPPHACDTRQPRVQKNAFLDALSQLWARVRVPESGGPACLFLMGAGGTRAQLP